MQKSFDESEVYKITKHGIEFWCRKNVDDEKIINDIVKKDFDKGEYGKLLPHNVKERWLDLGAHIGAFSLWINKRNNPLYITALEGSQENYSMLCKNLELNKNTNITPINAVVSDSKERILEFFINDGKMGCNHSLKPNKRRRKVQVENWHINDLLEFCKVDSVKIDIEGTEKTILPYILNNQYIRTIVFEWEDFSKTQNQLLELMKEASNKGFHINAPFDLAEARVPYANRVIISCTKN